MSGLNGPHGTCYTISWDDPAMGGGGGGCYTATDYALGGWTRWSGDPNHDDMLIAGVVAPTAKSVEVSYVGGRMNAPTYAVPDGYPVRFYVLDLPDQAQLIRFLAIGSAGRTIGHLDCRSSGQCITPDLGPGDTGSHP